MRKGQKKRVWTPEQKIEIVHKHLMNIYPLKNWKKSMVQTICGNVPLYKPVWEDA